MTSSTPSHDPDRRAAARSWYATAATAGVVAALALTTGFENASIRVAGILLAVVAAIAVTEGYRKIRRPDPSRLGVWVVALLTTAAALLCLFDLATGGLLR